MPRKTARILKCLLHTCYIYCPKSALDINAKPSWQDRAENLASSRRADGDSASWVPSIYQSLLCYSVPVSYSGSPNINFQPNIVWPMATFQVLTAAIMKMTALWNVVRRSSGRSLPPWCLKTYTRLHRATSQKTSSRSKMFNNNVTMDLNVHELRSAPSTEYVVGKLN